MCSLWLYGNGCFGGSGGVVVCASTPATTAPTNSAAFMRFSLLINYFLTSAIEASLWQCKRNHRIRARRIVELSAARRRDNDVLFAVLAPISDWRGMRARIQFRHPQ